MPTISETQILPPLDWQDFQRLCWDLWKVIWDNPNIQEYGRVGQRQDGVDIQGRIKNRTKYGGVQCKEKDNLADKTLTIDELREEVTKAKKFTPPLSEFVLAYTGPKDVALQDEANRLTEKHRKKNLFSVSVWSWDDIRHELTSHQSILQKHFPHLYGSTVAIEQFSKEVISETTQEIRITSNEIGKRIDSLSAAVTDINTELKEHSAPQLDAELAHTKRLIESFKPKACIEYLDELIRTKWESCSDKTRFKLLSKKGGCLLQQGKPEDAAHQLIRALQYDKEDEKALANAALGYFLLNDKARVQECIDLALTKNPLSIDIWTIQIQSADTAEALQEIIAKTPPSLLEKTEVLWAHSTVLQRLNSFSEAELVLTKALQNDKERRLDLVVQLGSLKLKNCLDSHRIIGSQNPTSESLSILNSSVSLLSEAVKRLSESEIVPIRIQALLNRGIAYRFLNLHEDSKKDLDQVIEWDPNNYQAIKHRAILATIDGAYDVAIEKLQPFRADGTNFEAKILLADNYRLSGKPAEAVSLLQDCHQWVTDKDAIVHGLTICFEAYIALEDQSKALDTIELMKSITPDSFMPLVHQARLEKLFGKKEVAREIALTAKALVGSEVDYFDERQLADELFDLELFADSAAIYSRIAIPGKNDRVSRQLVESYYQAEIYDKALEWCDNLRKAHPDLQYVAEIAAVINESTGNLPDAINSLREYLKRKPNDGHARLRLASIFWRAGQKSECEQELSLIANPLELGPRGVLQFGGLQSAKGDVDGAIRLFYEARRKYPNDADIDMAYISSILGKGERISILQEPEIVAQDTVVLLETANHDKVFYIIEDRVDVDAQKNELNISNPLAVSLLGKRVGTQIDIEQNPIQPQLWTIYAIKSKYAHVLHESLDNHQRRYPGRGDFFAIRTPMDESGEVDGNELRKQMISTLPDESGRIAIEEYYKDGKLTLGSVANLAKRDILSTLVYLGSRPEIGIFSTNGSTQDYSKALSLLAASKGIVVDITSILIMEFLGIKELLSATFGPFIIAQSTLDELNKILALRSMGGNQPTLTIFQQGGELFKQEISVEEKQKQIDSLTSLIQWLKANTKIIPVNLALSMKKADKDEMDKFFGVSLFDSLLIAKEHDFIFYTEDGRFRLFAATEHSVGGVWTHCLIKDALNKDYITAEQFDDYTLALLSMNVHHVPIDSRILLVAAQKAQWRVDYPLQSALFNLSGSRSVENAAINVAGEFIYSLFMQTISSLNKDTIIIAVLDSICSRRNLGTVTTKLASYLEHKFRLWPQASSTIVGLIQSWAKSRIG